MYECAKENLLIETDFVTRVCAVKKEVLIQRSLKWKKELALRYFAHCCSPDLEKTLCCILSVRKRTGRRACEAASLTDSSHGRSEIDVGNNVAKYAYTYLPALRI